MTIYRVKTILATVLLSTVLLVTSCAQKAPSRFDQAQQASSQARSGQAVTKNATQGSQFNKFFPPSGGGYQRVYTQEKKGFAQAKLKKNGTEVAVLSISDTSSIPTTAAKYQQSGQTIAGYPAREIGSTQTAILVGKRYQVKIQSRDPSFTASDRKAWLAKFNLSGLARL
ncbi:MAG: hypothetical protein F6K10_08030 [Moorea sp. SIO2B7]|nr:hypothetical protein [Moorena sp. SIO2B7]